MIKLSEWLDRDDTVDPYEQERTSRPAPRKADRLGSAVAACVLAPMVFLFGVALHASTVWSVGCALLLTPWIAATTTVLVDRIWGKRLD
jgi:hypothetical protein